MLKAQTPTRWQRRPPADPEMDDAALAVCATEVSRGLAVPPLVAELLALRGLATPDAAGAFLKPKLADLPDPATLPGAEPAAQRLATALHEGQPVVIYGDYDVDGVTASAILYHMLTALGDAPGRVATYVPHRIDEGYGLNEGAIRAIASYEAHPQLRPDDGRPPLIVTVDCGITATGPAALAKQLGVDLIITDHHAFDPAALPDAAALVHPELGISDLGFQIFDVQQEKRSPPASALKSEISNLKSQIIPPPCGAGVAFLLAWHTARVALGVEKLPPALQQLLVDLLPLAALGTVADMVQLRGVNRQLTHHGLARIRQTRFAGLNALIRASGLDGEAIDAYHVGFVLGPRLNAAGRMGHAREAVELLTTATGTRADELAKFLTSENESRKAAERAVTDEAVEKVESEGLATPDRRAIVVHGSGWHPGVVGIVASRLVNRYHRPVVVLSDAPPPEPPEPPEVTDPSETPSEVTEVPHAPGDSDSLGVIKGSARSVPGVHIQQCFTACAQHLQRFGGHAMAAGLTLEADKLDDFRDALITEVNGLLGEDALCRTVRFDADVSERDLTVEAFGAVHRLAPFGQGNPTPKLRLRGATVDRPPRRVGRSGGHLSLHLRCGRVAIKAIAFGQGDAADQLGVGDALDVVFEPKLNTWNGVTRPEMVVVDFAVAGERG